MTQLAAVRTWTLFYEFVKVDVEKDVLNKLCLSLLPKNSSRGLRKATLSSISK